MNQRERYGILAEIQERLSELGAEDWYKERLARTIFLHFPDDPIGVINTFHENGWHPSDIYHWLKQSKVLRENNPFWADSYQHVFFLEKMFVNAGLSKTTAHSFALTQPWMFSAPPFTLEFSIKTLIHLGYDEEIIRALANKMRHVFLLLPDHLVDECKRATKNNRGLLSNARLTAYSPVKREVYYQKNVGVNKPKPVARKADVDVEPLRTPAWPFKQKVIAPPVEIAKRTDGDTGDLPKLKLFNPSANPISPKPPPIPSDDEEDGYGKEKIVYRDPTPEDDNTGYATLDLKRFKSLLEAAYPDADEDLWDKFYAKHDWMSRVDSCEYQACLLLNNWVPLTSEVTPTLMEYKTDFGVRIRFWRAVLLDEKLSQILRVQGEVLELRMYVLRKIDREFLIEPEWLLREWEILNDVELRYRMNEIEARGKKPNLKPFINMILEPERAIFLERLEKFLASRRRRGPSYLPEIDIRDEIEIKRVLAKELKAAKPLEPKIKALPKGKRMTKEELRAKLLKDRKKK
ncbi:MAG: hypothetical protein P1P90_06605 [Patescibacteria group bacterium]|nr:hypothetical protein [Patescibacteria group bacterium]